MISLHLIVSCGWSPAVATFIPGCSPFFLLLGLRRLATFGSVSGGWLARSSTSCVRCKSASRTRLKLRQLRRERRLAAIADLTLFKRTSRPALAVDDEAIPHFVDPITGFGYRWIMR